MTGPTYRLDEITHLANVSRRTVRYYVEKGLLPASKPRGGATVYSREQLLRLQAITLLRRRDRLPLNAVQRRLASMSPAELEALVAPPPPPEPPPATSEPLPTPAPALAAEPAPAGHVPCVRWDHVELVRGLELRVRSDAGPLLRRLALEIYRQYAAAALDGAAESGLSKP